MSDLHIQSSMGPIALSLEPEPDLHPIYPTSQQISALLSGDSGLAPAQKAELVSHCLLRACLFGDLSILSSLLSDSQAQQHVDLSAQDEDGLGLIEAAILGFGTESDRDVEREECVRLLVSQGADVNRADRAGWTPLHYAALVAPPTLVTYLLTHGSSIFSTTSRGLTPLDIVTAESTVPGREDVALLLEEAMRAQGWTGGRMEEKRRISELRSRRKGKQRSEREQIQRILEIGDIWWQRPDFDDAFSDTTDDEDNDPETINIDDAFYTPPPDYASMLVFDPPSLPYIFQSLIMQYQPSIRDATPANMLYMLSRFACLKCDHTWLEDLIIGATDSIEEAFFNSPDDITTLLFWLYNTTVWLHLMRCDKSINEACEMLNSFVLIEEVINSVFVFIIRFAERRIDQLLDGSIIDHVPVPSDLEAIQFESEWSFLRSFGSKKKITAPSSPNPPVSPPLAPVTPNTSLGQTIRNSLTRGRPPTSTTPLSSLFPDGPSPPSPSDIISFITALHTLMVESGINPAFITQIWSQVMYWTACEIFNRILTRKKFLCRSRAMQIGLNIAVLEDWVSMMDLPKGVASHFTPVRDLISWLQCLSSISEFSTLIDTLQHMKALNPLQMRRAVRDYKYEVNETRMTEECNQYLAQLQKDWERHRVKLGVEAMRKEIDDRERFRDDSDDSHDDPDHSNHVPSPAPASETVITQAGIDLIFDREQGKAKWEPARPPQVLGELMDSRHMLPLLLPSDPLMLAALPGKVRALRVFDRSPLLSPSPSEAGLALDDDAVLRYVLRSRKLRDVSLDTLRWVDGSRAMMWTHHVDFETDQTVEDEETGNADPDQTLQVDVENISPMVRRRSERKGRENSVYEQTPIRVEHEEFDQIV